MASIIDPEKAKSLISEYRQQNASEGGPGLKTTEGHFLNGFFLNRESLEKILSNPKAIGVSVHLAKHPQSAGSNENHVTLMYAAAEPNTAPDAKTQLVNTGEMYGDPPPCPTLC